MTINNAVFNNHFSFGIKGIISSSHGSTIRICMTSHKTICKINGGVHRNLMSIANEIIIVVIVLNQLVSGNLFSVLIEVSLVRSSQKCSSTVISTIIIQNFTGCTQNSIHPKNNTRLHVALSAEKISLSVNLVGPTRCHLERSISVVSRAKPISKAISISYPHARGKSSIVKDKLYIAIGIALSIDASKCCFVKEVPNIFDC